MSDIPRASTSRAVNGTPASPLQHQRARQTASPAAAAAGAANGDGSGNNSAESKAKRKKSQRPSWSCTECTRRKIKCNRIVPGCDQCLKRNSVALCKLEAETELLESGSSSIGPPGEVRLATSTEYAALVQSVSAIKLKLYHLERVMASFVPAGVLGEDGSPMYSFSADGFSQRPPHIVANVDQTVRDATPTLPSLDEETAFERAQRIRRPGMPLHGERMLENDNEVEAAVTLEFLALGKDRKLNHVTRSDRIRRENIEAFDDHVSSSKSSNSASWPSEPMPPASELFPARHDETGSDHASHPPLPHQSQSEAIVRYSLERVGWQHCAVHNHSFVDELAHFHHVGSDGVEMVNQAWYSLYLAVLAVGIKHMNLEDAAACGLSAEQTATLPKQYFDAAVDALHRSNFLVKHDVYAVQAITILVLTCQDVGEADLIATLLACGIRIAIHLHMHRVPSDAEWEEQRRNSGIEIGSPAYIRQLIDREVKKRLWTALCTEDWISIPYRRSFTVSPSTSTTPLPNNVLDEDLAVGRLIIRGPSEPAPVAKLIVIFKAASCVRRFFEDVNAGNGASYDLCLEIDRELRHIIAQAPAYLQPNANLQGYPPFAKWMHHYFQLSISHKLLVVHRVFLARSFKDARFNYSRDAAISAARAIIHELVKGSQLPFQHIWTVPYHAIVGATTLVLDVFQCSASDPRDDVAAKRHEVGLAIAELRLLAPNSAIAARGVHLLSMLLAEESKHRAMANSPSSAIPNRAGNKRKATSHDSFGEVAKRVASDVGSEVERRARTPTNRPTPTSSLHASPVVAAAATSASTTEQDVFEAVLLHAGIKLPPGPPGQDTAVDAIGYAAGVDFWRALDATAAAAVYDEGAAMNGRANEAASSGSGEWQAALPYEFGGAQTQTQASNAPMSYDGNGWS